MAITDLFSKKAALNERDSFALSVLLEMVQAESFNGEFSKEQARIAYSTADVMLAVRNSSPKREVPPSRSSELAKEINVIAERLESSPHQFEQARKGV